MVCRNACPLISRSLWSLTVDVATNPLHPTSTGQIWTFQPGCLALTASSQYHSFSLSKASYMGHSGLNKIGSMMWVQPQHNVWSKASDGSFRGQVEVAVHLPASFNLGLLQWIHSRIGAVAWWCFPRHILSFSYKWYQVNGHQAGFALILELWVSIYICQTLEHFALPPGVKTLGKALHPVRTCFSIDGATLKMGLHPPTVKDLWALGWHHQLLWW